MSNSIAFQGNLTNDPEVKQHDGKQFTSFSIAENFGKEKDQVHYFRCSASGKQGELIASSCKKGHKLTVLSGQLKASLYTNPQGQSSVQLNVYVNSFAFCEPFNAQEQQSAPNSQQRPPAQQQYAQPPQQNGYQQQQPGYGAPQQQQGYNAQLAQRPPQQQPQQQGFYPQGAPPQQQPAPAPQYAQQPQVQAPQQQAPWAQPQQPVQQQQTQGQQPAPWTPQSNNAPF